jgi:hypothetical protein
VSPLRAGDLVRLRRPNAEDVTIPPGAPIWYRQTVQGGYGHTSLVPGVFERYGVLRVAVVLRDALGHDHRVYVSARNIYPRQPEDVTP